MWAESIRRVRCCGECCVEQGMVESLLYGIRGSRSLLLVVVGTLPSRNNTTELQAAGFEIEYLIVSRVFRFITAISPAVEVVENRTLCLCAFVCQISVTTTTTPTNISTAALGNLSNVY